MTLLKKTRDEVIAEAVRSLQEAGVVSNLNAGGVARSLVEIIGQKIGEVYDALGINMAMRFPTTAVGVYLDLIAESYGISRRQSTQATVDAGDNILKFYVSSGRLATVIPTKFIPRDTKITSADGSIEYTVTEDTYFDDTARQVWVSAIATTAGLQSNVGPGVLTVHDLGVGSVFVTNVEEITSGLDIERDQDLRQRLVSAQTALAQANPTAVRLAVSSLNNVADVRVREFSAGTGTVDILIIPRSAVLGISTIREARQALDRVRASGVRVTIREPEYIPVSTDIQLIFQNSTSDAEKSRIIETAQRSLVDYLDDIRLGGTLVINELRQRVMQSSEQIFDMRIHCLNINRRPQLLVNYRLADDELFVLDPRSTNPVNIIGG